MSMKKDKLRKIVNPFNSRGVYKYSVRGASISRTTEVSGFTNYIEIKLLPLSSIRRLFHGKGNMLSLGYRICLKRK